MQQDCFIYAEQFLRLSKELRPRLKSFGETGDTVRQEEFLTLKVHGISEAGPEVKSDLVQVLDNRLDDAVLEVLSVMLARNPMCKLSPEDVHFIQKPYHLPESTVQFSLPSDVLDNLQSVMFYLRQNLMQFLHQPKYTDTRTLFHFQDYSHPENTSKQVTESNIFLYNQSPSSGNKGIACIAFALVDSTGELIENLTYKRPSMFAFQEEPFSASHFNILTSSNICLQSDEADNMVRVEFRLWKQGRVNVESLTLKLKAAIRHALWDLVLEVKLLTAPFLQVQLSDRALSTGFEECDGPLNPVYQSIIAPWMQFGYKLGAPAMSTHVIVLTQRHPVNVTLKEISNLVSSDGTSSFVFYQKEAVYLPYNWSNLPSSTNCLLIARNIEQWRACLMEDPKHCLDKIEPKAQKVLQKFSPMLMMIPGGITQFVPRQRFLIAIVNNEKVILHLYNWAKDLVEMLVKQMALLGQWLSARSNLQIGVVEQKMGLFLNQPMSRKNDNQAGNPFMSQIGDVESLVSFSGSIRNVRHNMLPPHQMQEAMRDTKPLSKRVVSSDHVATSVQQILDIKAQDKRGHQKKLYTMWQNRGATPNIPIAEDVLEVFMLYSRIIHYCITPLLFLPRWRIQSASTRDFSLKTHKSVSQTSLQESNNPEDKWHHSLCANFLNEYKQYLQSLGFIPIQIVPASPKKGFRTAKHVGKAGRTMCYLQKSLLGGILLFELCLVEPFFNSKLHALECSRLEGKVSSGLISQFTQSFLDECDKVKVLMHLHSFTYDYHLRTLTRFISGQDSVLKPGYHIISFLDDFLKYYSKAPNYAYSLVQSGNLVIPKISSPAHMLFNYLLSHEENYSMKVLRMITPSQEREDKSLPFSNEYVLVQRNSSSQMMYRDIQDNKQVYEYDIVLVVTNEEILDQSILKLRYFILLTSRREPYAKLENERKLGKFCTVSTANPQIFTQQREMTPPIQEDTQDELTEGHHNSPKGQQERRPSSQQIEIKPESVNYLGYYSSHEQFMQQLILDQAKTSRRTIEKLMSQVSLHCRTHFLWNKLTTVSPPGLPLTYAEFCELLSLGKIEALSNIDPRISPILAQPISWYQGLIKLLMTKYSDHHRTFVSIDGSLQYFLVLHPRISDGFIMISLDQESVQGELNVVTCQTLGDDYVPNALLPSFIEDVINACCFQLWTGLL